MTPDRIAALGPDFEPLPTGPALLRHWLDRLDRGERKVLDVLVDAHPHPLTKAEIGLRTAYKATSVDTFIGRLKARRVVRKAAGGAWAADARLF